MGEKEPTIYSTLIDHRTDELEKRIESELREEAMSAMYRQVDLVYRMIRRAYIAGVTDDFAQGVAAADEKESSGD